MQYDPTPPPQPSATTRFLTAHWRIGRAFNEYLNALLLERYSLNLKDFLVLASIDRGAAYPSEVSERLKLPRDMTSRILQTLLKAGLIDRAIDDKDSRRTRLEATEKGRGVHESVHHELERVLEPLLERLPIASADFLTALETLNETLNDSFAQTLAQPGEPHV
jgi:DNA-binding MarR family transcriptional regulator